MITHFKPFLLTDLSRLQEIYNLRVVAWESSAVNKIVTKELFPNGWSDEQDIMGLHWIITKENHIIASARLNIINSIKELEDGYAFEKFDVPNTAPIAFYSRLVIHPNYRKLGLSSLLDIVRLKYIKRNNINYAIASCHDERLKSLTNLGFTKLGKTKLYYNKKSSDEQTALIIYTKDIKYKL